MIKINLLPVKAAKKKEKIINQMLIGALIVILALVGIGWRYITQKQSIAAVEQQIKDTDQKILKLRDAKKKFEELLHKKEVLLKQLKAIQDLDEGRDWFIRVIDKITESVPHNQLWIDTIKFGGVKGKGSSESTIVIKGRAYDRDAVAIYMGNLSIIPCDDQLPDEEKAEVCRQRNNSCRRWNEEKKNWEWDYESCRQFYKNTCSIAETCGDDVKICTQNQSESCRVNRNSPACKEAKQTCEEQKKKCSQSQDDCKKLHLEEYVVYNDISLSYITSRSDSKSGANVYDFELRVKATSATK